MLDCIVYVFLCLTYSLSIVPSRSIHIVPNSKISFYTWLANIPLCMCVYMYIYIYMHTHIYIYTERERG